MCCNISCFEYIPSPNLQLSPNGYMSNSQSRLKAVLDRQKSEAASQRKRAGCNEYYLMIFLRDDKPAQFPTENV